MNHRQDELEISMISSDEIIIFLNKDKKGID
jgi:hypothetical protein